MNRVMAWHDAVWSSAVMDRHDLSIPEDSVALSFGSLTRFIRYSPHREVLV